MGNPFRNLPAVNDVLDAPPLRDALVQHAREIIVGLIREELDGCRARLAETGGGEHSSAALAARVAQRLTQELKPKLRAVINATGIVLHTNLGRAPMAAAAGEAARAAACGYLNLELQLESGKRSSRQDAVREWICKLVGAESATAVNNNAAATVIALRALALGKEVITSRGELVEIGGSFRIPDIMRVSGAILREVGTTNMTRIADYEKAITDQTAVLLRVHASNYRITGHTEKPTLEELVALGNKYEVPVVDDIGSGALVDFARWGFHEEPLARQSLAAGVDLVLFSGDKLLGGPQAGILAGRSDLIRRIEKDPLMRAFRLDKMSLAALEATLRIYLNPERALKEIPVLRMLETPLDELRRRAEALAADLRGIDGVQAQVMDDGAYVGGGSLPDEQMPTITVAVRHARLTENELAQRLRMGEPAVMARVQDGLLRLDLRTIFVEQLPLVVQAVAAASSDTP
jgi:L-seryl-tRNA(Ser) seleniumtransferase